MAAQVKIVLTSTIHTPFPKLIVILTVCCSLSLCLATITRARSAANTMVDIIAVATDNTREMIQGAGWNTQHEAITGRAVRNARPAATGWSTSKMVRTLRMRPASSGSFVTTSMNCGLTVYPSCGPTQSPLSPKNVGLFNALEYGNGNAKKTRPRIGERQRREGGQNWVMRTLLHRIPRRRSAIRCQCSSLAGMEMGVH